MGARPAKREHFKSTIEIVTDDRLGALADISVALSSMRISISTLMAREVKTGENVVTVTFTVSDIDQLNFIINNLKEDSRCGARHTVCAVRHRNKLEGGL